MIIILCTLTKLNKSNNRYLSKNNPDYYFNRNNERQISDYIHRYAFQIIYSGEILQQLGSDSAKNSINVYNFFIIRYYTTHHVIFEEDRNLQKINYNVKCY